MRKGFSLLAVMILATVPLSGCYLEDWYNMQGNLSFYVAGHNGPETHLSDFSSVKVLIRYVQFRPADGTAPHTEWVNRVVDVAEIADGGPQILFTLKMPAKEFSDIRVIVNLTEAIHVDGTRPRVDATPPEGFYAAGSRVSSPSIEVPRGDSQSFQFAFTVNKQPPRNIYFLQSWPSESKPI